MIAFGKRQLGFLQFLDQRFFGKCHQMSVHGESVKEVPWIL